MQLSQSLTYLRVKNTCCHCPVEAAATECFLTYLLRHPSCLTRTEACYLPYKLPKKQSTPMIWNCHLCYLISIDFLTFSDTSFNTNANPLLVNTIKSFPNLWWLYVYRTLEWVCTKKTVPDSRHHCTRGWQSATNNLHATPSANNWPLPAMVSLYI